MPDLGQVRPLAPGAPIGPRFLARAGELPPLAGNGIGPDGRHVGVEVLAVVLEVGEEDIPAQEDAVVADVGPQKRGLDAGWDGGVQVEVLTPAFGPESDGLGDAPHVAFLPSVGLLVKGVS
jgi:hypothetical protein